MEVWACRYGERVLSWERQEDRGIIPFFLGGGQRPLGAGRRYPLFTLRKPWPQNGSSLSGIVAVRVLRSHLLNFRRLGKEFLLEGGGLRKSWGLSCCGNSRGFRRGR